MESFDVTAKCVDGFEGTAKVKKCSKPGGSYSLSGCSYGGACTAPESTEGYLVTEVELRKTDLDVTAECAPNYIGTAAVTPCSDDLGSYALTGCEAEKKCFSPASDSSEGYDLVENSVAMENFDVTATCKSTHVGTPQVTACTRPLTPYTIAGCEEKIVCVTPSETKGYKITEVSKLQQTFDVKVECDLGYEGTASVTACSATGEVYTLGGCTYSTDVCVAPESTEGYLVTETNLRQSVPWAAIPPLNWRTRSVRYDANLVSI